jgi:hypothetical protein
MENLIKTIQKKYRASASNPVDNEIIDCTKPLHAYSWHFNLNYFMEVFIKLKCHHYSRVEFSFIRDSRHSLARYTKHPSVWMFGFLYSDIQF